MSSTSESSATASGIGRNCYTISKKLAIIKEVETKGNLDKVAREHKIDRRCIQRWRKSKEQLLIAAQSRKGGSLARMKRKSSSFSKGKYPELERLLKEHVMDTRAKG